MAIHDPNLGRECYTTAPEVDISDERETKVTDEIREVVGAVLDCIDYVCDKLQIPDEKQRKALDYIMDEIIVPGAVTVLAEKVKDFLKDELKSDIEHYAEKQQSYTTYSRPRPTYEKRVYERDDLIFSTRAAAEVVLNRLNSYIHDYGQVTVGYLYELIGKPSPYTTEYYGWTNLDDADIKVDSFGSKYKLCLPRPVRLEDSK